MFYLPACNRLLGLPEEMVDPNPGELLGLDPEYCTAAEVKQALRDRKVTLRLSLPGPQYVPVVPWYEKTLNQAAATLIDPDRRAELLRRIAAEARSDARQTERAARRDTLLALREMIGRSLASDGTLDAGGRATLAEALRGHGADAHIVASVLAEIPRPPDEGDRSRSRGIGRTRKFFEETAQMAVAARGVGEEVRRDLMALAGRLNVPTDLAERTLAGESAEVELEPGDQRRMPTWALATLLALIVGAIVVAAVVARRPAPPREAEKEVATTPADAGGSLGTPARRVTKPPVKPPEPDTGPIEPEPAPSEPSPPTPDPRVVVIPAPVGPAPLQPAPPLKLVDTPVQMPEVRDCTGVEDAEGDLRFNVGGASAVLKPPPVMDPRVRFHIDDEVLHVFCPTASGLTWGKLLRVRLVRRDDGALDLVWHVDDELEPTRRDHVNYVVIQIMDVDRNVVYRCRKTRAAAFTVMRLAYDKTGRRRSVPASLFYPWPPSLTLRGEAVNEGVPLSLDDPESPRRSVTAKMLLRGVQIRGAPHDVDVQLAFALKPDALEVNVVSEKLEDLIGEHAEGYEALRKKVSVRKVNASSAKRQFEEAGRKLAEADAEYKQAQNATVPYYLNDPDRTRREQRALERRRARLLGALRRAERSFERAREENAKAAAALEAALNEQQATPEPAVFARDALVALEPVLRDVRPIQVLDTWGAPALVIKIMVDPEIAE